MTMRLAHSSWACLSTGKVSRILTVCPRHFLTQEEAERVVLEDHRSENEHLAGSKLT